MPLAQEEFEQYDWAWVTTRAGERLGRALKRKPTGECIYLASKVASSMDALPTFVRDSIAALSSKTRIVRADGKQSRAGKFPKPSSTKGEKC